MSIKVGNIKTHKKDDSIAIKVDRTSVLGNPFFTKGEWNRELVCARYEEYFIKKIEDGTDLEFLDELERIGELSLNNEITLLCWCSPKPCHAETIKKYLDYNYGDN